VVKRSRVFQGRLRTGGCFLDKTAAGGMIECVLNDGRANG